MATTSRKRTTTTSSRRPTARPKTPAPVLAAPVVAEAETETEEAAAPEPRQHFAPWYHPGYRGIVLRPSPNQQIRFENHRYIPRNAQEDAIVRRWITRQRRGNDPERWHGDTPGMRDLVCGFCKASFRNQNVYDDHIQLKHLREEQGDLRLH